MYSSLYIFKRAHAHNHHPAQITKLRQHPAPPSQSRAPGTHRCDSSRCELVVQVWQFAHPERRGTALCGPTAASDACECTASSFLLAAQVPLGGCIWPMSLQLCWGASALLPVRGGCEQSSRQRSQKRLFGGRTSICTPFPRRRCENSLIYSNHCSVCSDETSIYTAMPSMVNDSLGSFFPILVTRVSFPGLIALGKCSRVGSNFCSGLPFWSGKFSKVCYQAWYVCKFFLRCPLF